MHKFVKAFVVILIVSIYSGCTVDDICSEETQTTPNLVISFTDNNIAELIKPLEHLQVENLEHNTIVWDAPADSIRIPLSTEGDRSTYAFTIIKNGEERTNIYQFDYQREEVYVNRACGFKMRFTNLQAEDISDSDTIPTWAKNITVLNPIIEDEKSTHITILH